MIHDMPRGRRNGEPFEDLSELLSWLIARLADPCRTQLQFTVSTTEEHARLETSLGFVRAQLVHARAAHRLAHTDDSEAAYPIVRTMFEIWAEMAYLNEEASTDGRVWAHRAWALLVARDGSERPAPEIVNAVEAFEHQHPSVFELTHARYKKGRTGHYSGLGRLQLIRTYCDESAARAYKWLSWSAHPIVQGITHVPYANAPVGGRLAVNHFRSADARRLDIAAFAVHSLSESWTVFHHAFGQKGRALPRSRLTRP
jgi:hypothetical protein